MKHCEIYLQSAFAAREERPRQFPSLVLRAHIRQPKKNRDVFFRFRCLSAEKCWRVAPLANSVHGRGHKQGRAAQGDHILRSSIPIKDGMHFNRTFYALLFGILRIHRIDPRNQMAHLQAFSLARLLGVFLLR